VKSELEGKRVLVLGLGMSGRSAANFCAERGAAVVAADERSESELQELAALESAVETRVGGPLPDPADFDVVVPSPGVPASRYAERARCVWGDIELTYRALQIPIVAVTGTNGKSTTVRLIESMLRSAGLRARAAGNVGTPALDLVGAPLDAAVLEVSSFQLEAVDRFAPRVAVILNITPDHLDRHDTLEAYTAAKQRILAAQTPDDVAILNFDDPHVRALASTTAAEVLPFSVSGRAATSDAARSVYWDSNSVVLRSQQGTQRLELELQSLPLLGVHNLENTLASLAAVWGLGADPNKAVLALADFAPLPHRCELVARRNGVSFINDSKATNVGAAVRCLEGFDTPIHWIAGGRDKNLDFEPLAAAASGRVRRAYLIGETADRLQAALGSSIACQSSVTLERAVRDAAAQALPGEIVLLCPACASFDQFTDFADRGEAFRRIVAGLATGGTPS
jgi:UDP-N-acetylmuramoylalanine--D-glutamate ligase